VKKACRCGRGANARRPNQLPHPATLSHYKWYAYWGQVNTTDLSQRYKMVLRQPGSWEPGRVMTSPDGIHWSEPVSTPRRLQRRASFRQRQRRRRRDDRRDSRRRTACLLRHLPARPATSFTSTPPPTASNGQPPPACRRKPGSHKLPGCRSSEVLTTSLIESAVLPARF